MYISRSTFSVDLLGAVHDGGVVALAQALAAEGKQNYTSEVHICSSESTRDVWADATAGQRRNGLPAPAGVLTAGSAWEGPLREH